jgi:Gas vesicle synthesis protein GvpL/GvpF
VLYLYAFSERPTTLPTTLGIGSTPLAVESLDAIDAVIGEIDAKLVEQSNDAILAHAHVVDALASLNAAVLPARFGRGYDDAAALRRAVEERADVLRAALDRVRGCVELGLRALAPEGKPSLSGASGREYMLGRLEERRSASRLADELHAPLAALAQEHRRNVGEMPLFLSAAYLVPREAVDAFRSMVARLEQAHPELTLACTGPWPAYSFATAETARE